MVANMLSMFFKIFLNHLPTLNVYTKNFDAIQDHNCYCVTMLWNKLHWPDIQLQFKISAQSFNQKISPYKYKIIDLQF